jgi:hypothetical protein
MAHMQARAWASTATIHSKSAGSKSEGLPRRVIDAKQQDTEDGDVLSGDTSSAPHPSPMSMPTQKSQLSVGSGRSRGHRYLQRVSKETLVKAETEMISNY